MPIEYSKKLRIDSEGDSLQLNLRREIELETKKYLEIETAPNLHPALDEPHTQANRSRKTLLKSMVGVTGFEPATYTSRT